MPPRRDTFGEVLNSIGRAFSQLADNSDRIIEYLRASAERGRGPWKFVADLMPSNYALPVLLTVEALENGKPRAGELVARALRRPLSNPVLLADLRKSTEAKPVSLDSTHRRQVVAALDHLEARDFDLAGPLLINAIEGAFWRQAALRGVIVSARRDKWETSVGGRKIGGLEALLALPEMQLDPALQDCLKSVVYGTRGNAFRHGAAVEGWELRSLLLVAALIGLLGWLGAVDPKTVVYDALRGHRADAD